MSAVIEPDPLDGGFVASCPEMPGAVAQGETEHQARYELAAVVAGRLDLERLGESIAVVVLDHSDEVDGSFDPNVSELVHVLLHDVVEDPFVVLKCAEP